MDKVKVFVTKRGKYTTSKSQASEEMLILGNEHYARDTGNVVDVRLWGIQNKDTGKLVAVTDSRRRARKFRGFRDDPCRVVAMAGT